MILKKKNKSSVWQQLQKPEKQRLNRFYQSFDKHNTAKDYLYYQELFESGLMKITDDFYSKTYGFNDIVYSNAPKEKQDSIWGSYVDGLNLLTEEDAIQLSLITRRVSKEQYKKETNYPLKNDNYEVYREEFNELTNNAYKNGKSNFRTSKYFTFRTFAESPVRANSQLETVKQSFAKELSTAGVRLYPLSGQDRLEAIASITRPGKFIRPVFNDLKVLKAAGRPLSTKDILAPDSINPKLMGINVGEQFGRVLYVRDYQYSMDDRMVKELTEIGHESVIAIHAQPYGIGESSKMLRAKSVDIEAQMQKHEEKGAKKNIFTGIIPRKLREAYKDVDEQIDTLKDTGDRLTSSIFLIYLHEDTEEELQRAIKDVRRVGDKFGADFAALPLLQDCGFNSVLPLGMNSVDIESTFMRKLPTSNVGINVPFSNVNLEHKGGRYQGINLLSNSAILVNRKDPSLKNGSGVIWGSSGSGKSTTVKLEVISTRLSSPNDDVIMLDPEGEYSEIVREFGGEEVEISPDSDTYLNLLELPHADTRSVKENPYNIKIDFIKKLLTTISEDIGELSGGDRAIIERVTTQTYKDCAQKGKVATLKEWHEILNQQPEPEAQVLALSLEPYVIGSQSMFAHKTNINTKNSFISFNLKKLEGAMKVFGFLVISDFIWNRVVENKAKGKTTWVYIDEIEILFDDENLRKFFGVLYSRIRKYDGLPTAITQVPDNVLAYKEGQQLFENADYGIFLEQKSDSVINQIAKELNLSDDLKKYLYSSAKGGGLIRAGKTTVPFENTLPKESQLYKITNTDPDYYETA
ncbi:DUF87 domain-containing protein [Lactococcus lactis subsp. lactis]|uniref:VirB4-like conjugal transfer ATPase, CD1110 family n=3 Tax=Lactococcus lactis TaxID=1358 RepID=UPI00311DCCFE